VVIRIVVTLVTGIITEHRNNLKLIIITPVVWIRRLLISTSKSFLLSIPLLLHEIHLSLLLFIELGTLINHWINPLLCEFILTDLLMWIDFLDWNLIGTELAFYFDHFFLLLLVHLLLILFVVEFHMVNRIFIYNRAKSWLFFFLFIIILLLVHLLL